MHQAGVRAGTTAAACKCPGPLLLSSGWRRGWTRLGISPLAWSRDWLVWDGARGGTAMSVVLGRGGHVLDFLKNNMGPLFIGIFAFPVAGAVM